MELAYEDEEKESPAGGSSSDTEAVVYLPAGGGWLDLGNVDRTDPTPLSVEAWVKLDVDNAKPTARWFFRCGATQVFFRAGKVCCGAARTVSPCMEENTWLHIACVVSEHNHLQVVFVNGQRVEVEEAPDASRSVDTPSVGPCLTAVGCCLGSNGAPA